MERSEPCSKRRASAVDGQGVLHQVVRADAEESDILDQRVSAQRSGRRLDHYAERQVVTVLDAPRIELGGGLVQEVLRLLDLVERDDEREHDANVAVHRRAEERAKLGLEDLRLVEAHPDRAPAKKRICIAREAPDWKLVAAHVERAEDRKSTRLNSSHGYISYAVFCLK